MNWAACGPSPNTVWVAGCHSGHPLHPSAASLSAASDVDSGTNGRALQPVDVVSVRDMCRMLLVDGSSRMYPRQPTRKQRRSHGSNARRRKASPSRSTTSTTFPLRVSPPASPVATTTSPNVASANSAEGTNMPSASARTGALRFNCHVFGEPFIPDGYPNCVVLHRARWLPHLELGTSPVHLSALTDV